MQREIDDIPGAQSRQRGSALILVLLLMLALSAIGMVALQSVTGSVERSGLYRVRTTSSNYSDSVANLWLRHSARRTNEILRDMEEGYQCKSQLSGYTGAGGLRERMGPCARYTSSDDFGDILATSSDETGLFTDGSNGSFERQMEHKEFEVIVRYPYKATPATGFEEGNQCFRMVTVAVQAQMGKLSDSWSNPQQVGRGRTIFTGKIGPYSCDAGFGDEAN